LAFLLSSVNAAARKGGISRTITSPGNARKQVEAPMMAKYPENYGGLN
jgi:hypothetical protein